MAGNIGSPLCAELNRIANNGVYPDRDDFLEEQGAANVWAGTTGQGLLGALNYIVDPTRTENNFSDLTKVCNELAGTTGLSDVDALRTINHAAEVLLRGTTPQSASYYTDAATPRYNYPGYITFDGTSGNYISTPDATALDITGDIDIRAYVALDNWSSSNYLLAKFLYSGSDNRSYRFGLSAGLLSIGWSSAGTSGTEITKSSTVGTGVTNGTAKWVRVTLDVDNGASGNDVKFFLSDDGTTWTQLGATVTTAGTTSIYAGTANVFVGAENTGTTGNFAGKVYRAQVFAGLTGTDKRLDVDLTTNVTSATYDQFTATTGQLCTIFGQNTLTNAGKAGALLPTTVGSSLAADSNDPKFLDHTGTNYVYLPGRAADYLEVPDAAALDISGDIDLRWYGALDDWTPAVQNELLAKQTLSNRSYKIAINSTGFVAFQWSSDGSTVTTATSSVATGVTDGAAKWVRATMDVDNGASGNDVKFYLSDDGSTWTQLGTTVTTAGVTSLYVGTAPVRIGCIPDIATTPLTGKIYRAQILNGIDGTVVLDVDTSVITTGAATSFTALTSQTVTINRSTSGRKTVAVTQPTWLFGTDDYMEVNNRYMAHSTSDENYVYLSGNTNNNMTVADNPPLDVTGDIDIQIKVALDDWTPSAGMTLLGKWVAAAGRRSYQFGINATTGTLFLTTSADGTAQIARTSTVAPTITDGSTLWVRATLDVDNGAGGNTATFFTSNDGSTWNQLGSPVVNSGTTSIFSSAEIVEIGTLNGFNPTKGKIFRAIIKNGIDGTTVLDANAAVITLPSQTTFVDSSSNAYTVTINRSGVGTFVSTGNYLYLPGIASNYASAPDSAALDITGDIDLRVKVALDDWTPAASTALINKWVGVSQYSYFFGLNTSGTLTFSYTSDGSTGFPNAVSSVATGISDGVTKWVRVTYSSSTGNTMFFLSDDGTTWTQLGTTQTITAGTIFSGAALIKIGAQDSGNTQAARGKFFRAQVLNGIGGTVAFDANFEGSITSLNQASFTESSSNAATVTINRSGSTFRSAGVIDAGYLYPGATNTFSNSTTDFLSLDASTNMTVLMFRRKWNTSPNYRVAFSKGGYAVLNYETGNTIYAQLSQTTGAVTSFSTTWTPGALQYNGFVVDRTLGKLTTLTTNGGATPTSISGNVVFHATTSLTIAQNDDAELVAFAVFRSVLTAKNIADINNYFQGRD